MGTRIGLLTLALMLLPAAVASAEPDFNATLSGANPKFTWESSGTGVPDFSGGSNRCTGAPFTCEYILFNVETAGELALTLDSTDMVCGGDETCSASGVTGVQDIDGHLYRSNAAGEPRGMTLTNDCVTGSSSETCKVAVAPGFYLLEVEYFTAVEAPYVGTAELIPGPAPPVAETQITLEGCNFTLYYFKEPAERLQALVPPGYRVRPYSSGSATIAAAAYDCDRIEVPGSSPAPGIFTVLSVVVFAPGQTQPHGPARSDFYVLWIHASNPQLVDLLASGGLPAYLVPGMLFEKPAQSLAVRTEVPSSQGAYELGMTGTLQDVFHAHANSFWHDAADGRLVRLDFVTTGARDQFCFQATNENALPCGTLTAQAGTPVASFFGASDRSADNAWDHDPLERAEFHLSVSRPSAPGVQSPPLSRQRPPSQQSQPQPGPQPHSHPTPPGILPLSGPLTVSVAADSGRRSTARRRGLRVRVRCSVQCTSTAVATIDGRVARRLGLGKRAVRIARGKNTITRAGRIPFFLRLSPKAKKALARRKVKQFPVKVVVTVTDRQGRQLKRVTKRITLR